MGMRRGATVERLIAGPRADSVSAPFRGPGIPNKSRAVHRGSGVNAALLSLAQTPGQTGTGLKPTVTVVQSLRDCSNDAPPTNFVHFVGLVLPVGWVNQMA